MSKHTPGPWKTEMGFIGADRRLFVVIPGQDGLLVNNEANARLIAAAPAMDLALLMIELGIARIERTHSLSEFCFDGIRYCTNGNWTALMNFVGWDKARAAIAKAEQG